jgi:hypothetical protein
MKLTGSSGGTGGGRGTTTDGEHQLVGTAILQETGEKSRPVGSNGVVARSEEGADVGSGDLGLAIIEGKGSKTGHKFVLKFHTIKKERKGTNF